MHVGGPLRELEEVLQGHTIPRSSGPESDSPVQEERLLYGGSTEDHFQPKWLATGSGTLLYVSVSLTKHETAMSIYSDKLAHIQVVFNCRYSVAQ